MLTRPTPPGPKGLPLLGSWKQFREGGVFFIDEVIRTYGHTAFVRIAHLNFYIFNEPEQIREVLTTQAKSFQKDRVMKKVLGRFIGNSLSAVDGEDWKRQRKIIQPAFSNKRLDDYGQVMIEIMTEQVRGWRTGQVIELEEETTKYTMDIINRTMFGTDLHGIAEPAALIGAVTKIQKTVRDELGAILVGLPNWIPTPNNRRSREALGVLDAMVHNLIRERRANGIGDAKDFLSLLLAAKDDDGVGLSDKQIRDELVTMFIAGQETAANALCWAWYLLAQHPEVENRIFQEVDEVVGQRPLTVSDLPKLEYMEMVLKESMRLYPPAPLLAREANEPVKVGDVQLRKGDSVLISLYSAHRHPRYFQDPERFDPERFSPEKEKDIPHFAYLPFGAGPRRCIGLAFSYLVMKIAVAIVAQRFRLVLAPGQQIIPEPQLTIHPKYGMYMQPTPRTIPPSS